MNRKRTIPETVQDDIAGFPPAVRTNLKKIGRRSGEPHLVRRRR